jgi:cystathionine beta-lyase
MPVRQFRTARPWAGDDLVLRVSIGLEDIADLEADIDRFLDHIGAGMAATTSAAGTI